MCWTLTIRATNENIEKFIKHAIEHPRFKKFLRYKVKNIGNVKYIVILETMNLSLQNLTFRTKILDEIRTLLNAYITGDIEINNDELKSIYESILDNINNYDIDTTLFNDMETDINNDLDIDYEF
jgi:hypothetical protein